MTWLRGITSQRRRALVVVTVTLTLPACVPVPAMLSPTPIVRVVQLIPPEIPDEEMNNPEPSIAVNPANPLEIVASAYNVGVFDPCAALPEGVDVLDGTAGTKLLRSLDGGATWSLHCVDRVVTTTGGAGDVSLDFDANQNLFASFIDNAFFGSLLRVTTATAPATWTVDGVTGAGANTDAPWAASAALGAGYAFGITNFPGPVGCKKGGLVVWGTLFSSPTATCISTRTTAGEDYTPIVKTAVNDDGTMYAFAYRPVSNLTSGDGIKADVVLRRHDSGAALPFDGLKDVPASSSTTTCYKRDGKAGLRLERCILVPTYYEDPPSDPFDSNFGNQRRTAFNVALAVAPGNSQRVAIVYGDSAPGGTSHMTLHVRISDDGGTTGLDSDILTVTDATNPALAFSASGRLGFSYQQLTTTEWHTTFVSFSTANNVENTTVLAKVPYNDPVPVISPYIGDYMDLASTSEDFLGVFSAGGRYVAARFPQGLTSYRTPPGAGVAVTIDPFFFRILQEIPPCASVALLPNALTMTVGTTHSLNAVAKDAYGYVLPAASLTWTSAAPVIASVSIHGSVTALAVGATTIVVRCGGAVAAGAMTVVPPA